MQTIPLHKKTDHAGSVRRDKGTYIKEGGDVLHTVVDSACEDSTMRSLVSSYTLLHLEASDVCCGDYSPRIFKGLDLVIQNMYVKCEVGFQFLSSRYVKFAFKVLLHRKWRGRGIS